MEHFSESQRPSEGSKYHQLVKKHEIREITLTIFISLPAGVKARIAVYSSLSDCWLCLMAVFAPITG